MAISAHNELTAVTVSEDASLGSSAIAECPLLYSSSGPNYFPPVLPVASVAKPDEAEAYEILQCIHGSKERLAWHVYLKGLLKD